jgi:hypothetical protein
MSFQKLKLFKKMNHQKVYDAIIHKAKSENRIKHSGIYYEEHHIIPRCIDGNNHKDNLVLLTAREHFICHKLLTYIYKGNGKISLAFFRMIYDKRERKISSRDYQYVRELNVGPSVETGKKISKALSKRNLTLEHKIHIGNGLRGKPQTLELIEKRAKGNRGQKRSEETKQKMRKPHNKNKLK